MNPDQINRFIDSVSPSEIAVAHLFGCAQTLLEHPDNFPAKFGAITLARLLEHALPPKTFATPNGGNLKFITVVRNDAYIPFQIPGHPVHATKVDSVMVCGGSMGRDMGFYAVNVQKGDFESTEYNPNSLAYADKGISTPQGVIFQKCDPTESEKLFEYRMFWVGLGLLMNMR